MTKAIFLGTLLFIVLVLSNLIYLDIKVAQQSPSLSSEQTPASSSLPKEVPLTQTSLSSTPGCDIGCQTYVTAQIAAAKASILSDISSSSTKSIAALSSPNPAAASAPVNYYLGFGSDGASQSKDWVSVNGTQINFNSANYPGAKAFYFQANLRSDAPDRGAWARVINTSTGGGIPGSDITMGGSLTSVFKESAAMSLPSGTALLQIQIHSLNGNFAYVEGAKLRIAY